MPKKIQGCSMAHLVSVPLPNHGTTYTVITHQFVIDYSKTALQNAGFTIIDEEYRCTADGQIAQGIYRLNYNSDPELSMMFAWTNSYNKQVRFKCGVGAYVNKTGTVMVCGDIGSWARKHTGTADTETQDTIDDQVNNAHMYYNQLVADKASMEGINMNKRKQAQMLGILFAEYQILTTEQASMVRQQMDRPSHVFANADSLWAFYNYVTVALQHSHPKTWMEDQRILHMFISEVNKFAPVSTPVPTIPVDPLATNYGEPENQTNLLVQIAEVTGDESVLEPSLPVEPADYDFTQTVDYSNAVYPKTEEQAFQNIKEVTEQALQDELVFGVSGVAVSAEGVRNVPIEEVLEKMQESDNQVVQDEVINADVLHQSEEIIEDTNEVEEDVFVTEDGIEVTEEELPWDNDQVVGYTDPDGNTFEAPIVAPCAAHDAETEREIQQENSEDIFPQAEIVSLEPTPEEYEQIEAEAIMPWNDDEEPLSDPLIEPAQVDNIEEAAVDPQEKTDYPITANLDVIESEDPDAFDLDFGDISTDSNTDFDF